MLCGKMCDKRNVAEKQSVRNFSLWSTAINVYYTLKSSTKSKEQYTERNGQQQQQSNKKTMCTKTKQQKNIIKNKHYAVTDNE